MADDKFYVVPDATPVGNGRLATLVLGSDLVLSVELDNEHAVIQYSVGAFDNDGNHLARLGSFSYVPGGTDLAILADTARSLFPTHLKTER